MRQRRPSEPPEQQPSPDPVNPIPDPEIMSASDVRQNFGSGVNRVARGEGRVVIEKHGSPVVGIVSIEDIRRLRRMDEVTSRRKQMLEAMRAPFNEVPSEELVREAEAAVAEVRAERKAERRRQQGEVGAHAGSSRHRG